MNTRTAFLLFSPVALVLALSGLSARAQGTTPRITAVIAPGSSHSAGQLTPADRRFMKDAAATGRYEVDASQLAMQRAGNPAVKAYAAMLVEHHGAANAELQRLAHARGMAAPLMENSHRKTLKKLAGLEGVKFDRAYVEQVGIKDHRQGIEAFEKASREARDPALKGWVDTTLPMIRVHLVEAQKLVARR